MSTTTRVSDEEDSRAPAPEGETPLPARLAGLLRSLGAGLLEREEAARLVLLAALAGEHVLLLGPPGTAKSELSRRLRGCLAEGAYFERLLTKFSVPEELFGPLSIKGLERDEYLRLVDGFLPTAAVAFLDEIFNANSAILNALLTLLNEREFDNGTRRLPTPLVSVVAATNHVPDTPELAALHDRFLFRHHVVPVSAEGFGALLDVPEAVEPPDPSLRFTPGELLALRRAAERVALPSSVRRVVEAMRRGLGAKGVYVSDRRWRKIARALRVAALGDGRSEVGLVDCWLMVHCLWDRPEQIEVVEGLLRATLDAALVDEPRRFVSMTAAFEAEIEKERATVEHACDEEGRPLYHDEEGHEVTEPWRKWVPTHAGQPLFLPPPGLEAPRSRVGFTVTELWEDHFQHQMNGFSRFEAWVENPDNAVVHREERRRVMVPARFPEEHRVTRRAQIDALDGEVRGLLQGIAALRGGGASLWVSEERRRSVATVLETAEQALAPILARLDRVREQLVELPGRRR